MNYKPNSSVLSQTEVVSSAQRSLSSGVSKNIISVMGMKVIQAAKNPFPPSQGWTGNGTQSETISEIQLLTLSLAISAK